MGIEVFPSIGIGIGIEVCQIRGIGIGIGIAQMSFWVLVLVLRLKIMVLSVSGVFPLLVCKKAHVFPKGPLVDHIGRCVVHRSLFQV